MIRAMLGRTSPEICEKKNQPLSKFDGVLMKRLSSNTRKIFFCLKGMLNTFNMHDRRSSQSKHVFQRAQYGCYGMNATV